MLYLVFYDIIENKKRNRLARYLETLGTRLQKSVFAVELERHELKRAIAKLEAFGGGDDQIAVVPLCAQCREKAMKCGREDAVVEIV